MYVPPSCLEEYQQEAIHYLNSLPTDCDIIALGDFNAPDIDWSTLTGTTNYSHSLCNAVYNKNLTQIIIMHTNTQTREHIGPNFNQLTLQNHQSQHSDFSIWSLHDHCRSLGPHLTT